jgi:hypothetical protein
MKILPKGCKGTQAPFTNNYCLDWWAYHVLIFCGTVVIFYYTDYVSVLIIAPVCGITNLLLDR